MENYKIYHSVDTKHGCSSSPIILTYRGFKIIVIQRAYIREKK